MLRFPSQWFFWIIVMSYIEGLVALNAFLWSLSSTIHQCNTVGALSQKTFSSTALLVISLAILLVGIGWVTYQYKNLKSFGLFSWILFLGGGCANMIERIRFSCVHDTLPFLFNIANNPADWSLGIGFFLILLYYGGWKPYK